MDLSALEEGRARYCVPQTKPMFDLKNFQTLLSSGQDSLDFTMRILACRAGKECRWRVATVPPKVILNLSPVKFDILQGRWRRDAQIYFLRSRADKQFISWADKCMNRGVDKELALQSCTSPSLIIVCTFM